MKHNYKKFTIAGLLLLAVTAFATGHTVRITGGEPTTQKLIISEK